MIYRSIWIHEDNSMLAINCTLLGKGKRRWKDVEDA